MIVLGIETSCDETAAAVVAATASGPRIFSNLVQSQLAAHMPFGGVVPEIAARAHLDRIDGLIERTLDLPTRDSRSEPDAEADEPRDGHPQPGNRPVGEALAELEPFAKSVAQCRYFAQPVAGPVADP